MTHKVYPSDRCAADNAEISPHAVRQWLSARGGHAPAVVTWRLVNMHFEWDEQKNQLNIKIHGIDFETAVLCWEDPSSFDVWDEKHSTLEEARWLRFGRLSNGKVVCVVYTELSEQRSRIISAFSDEKIERVYYEGQHLGR